jgi:hypothetical protein
MAFCSLFPVVSFPHFFIAILCASKYFPFYALLTVFQPFSFRSSAFFGMCPQIVDAAPSPILLSGGTKHKHIRKALGGAAVLHPQGALKSRLMLRHVS